MAGALDDELPDAPVVVVVPAPEALVEVLDELLDEWLDDEHAAATTIAASTDAALAGQRMGRVSPHVVGSCNAA